MQFKCMAALAAAMAVSACANWKTDYPSTLSEDVTENWHIDAVNIVVADDLTATEDNGFFPDADIVWHGELPGDRHAQVEAILLEAVTAGSASLTGAQHVELDVRLIEFHAVTPRAVASAPEAVHNIQIVMQAHDTFTKEIIAGPDLVVAQFEALTGAAAAVAAAEGRGQKQRIINHLTQVTAGWLAAGPDVRREFTSLGR